MNQQKTLLAEKISQLLSKLDTESANWLDEPENQQLWYNRGYVDGMAKALMEIGWQAQIPSNWKAASEAELKAHRWLPWGRAYYHGNEKGYQEILEVCKN